MRTRCGDRDEMRSGVPAGLANKAPGASTRADPCDRFRVIWTEMLARPRRRGLDVFGYVASAGRWRHLADGTAQDKEGALRGPV